MSESAPSKRLWFFQIGEPLPLDGAGRKMRTALLAEELAKRGHQILWWASAFDHQKKEWQSREFKVVPWKKSLDIALLKGCGYRRNLSLSRFVDHRLVARDFKGRAESFAPPDMVIASLPSYDLAYEAVRFAKKRGIPCLIDVRDPWPDLFPQRLPKPLRPLARALLWKDFHMATEALHQADAITSMIDYLLQWGLEKAKRKKGIQDRVFYLGCAKTQKSGVLAEKIKSLEPVVKGKFVVSFVGTFGYYNNPLILAQAARELQDRRDVHFILGGDGVYFSKVQEEVRGLTNVSLPGWLNQDEINSVLALSSVGVVPAVTDQEAFPNKAFVYFSAGLPVVSSSRGELWKVIEDERIGMNFMPGDRAGLRRAILDLSADPSAYRAMAANVTKVFDEKFDSEKIYRDFAGMIEEILKKKEKNDGTDQD